MDWFFDNLFWVLFGLVWTACGITLWYKSVVLFKRGKPTIGYIHDFIDSGGADSSGLTPRVRFKTSESADWVIHELGFSTSPPLFKKGQKVKIIYDPLDPSRVSLDSIFLNYWVPKLFVASGLAIFIYGLVKVYNNL